MAEPATFAEDPTGGSIWQSTYGTTKRIDFVATPSGWLRYIIKAAVDTNVHLAVSNKNDHLLTRVDAQLPSNTFHTKDAPPQKYLQTVTERTCFSGSATGNRGGMEQGTAPTTGMDS